MENLTHVLEAREHFSVDMAQDSMEIVQVSMENERVSVEIAQVSKELAQVSKINEHTGFERNCKFRKKS